MEHWEGSILGVEHWGVEHWEGEDEALRWGSIGTDGALGGHWTLEHWEGWSMGGVEHGGGQVLPSRAQTSSSAQTPFSASKGIQSSSCALNGIPHKLTF